MAEETPKPHLTKHQQQEERIFRRVVDLVRKEFFPPASTAADTDSRQLNQTKQLITALRRMFTSAMVALFGATIYEYLTLMGIVDTTPARIVLFIAWVICIGGVCGWEWLWVKPWHWLYKSVVGFVCIGVLGTGLLVLNKWAEKWKTNHPSDESEIHSMATTMKGMDNKLDQISGQKEPSKVLTSTQLQAVTGRESQPVTAAPKIPASTTKVIVQNTRGYLAWDTIPIGGSIKFAAGSPIVFNVTFDNKGGAYVHDADADSKILLFGVNNPNTVSAEAREQFKTLLRPMTQKQDVAPGEGLWGTMATKPLSEDVVRGLLDGSVRLYLGGRAQWTADGLPDSIERCAWLQPPEAGKTTMTANEMVWHRCGDK